MLRNLANVSAVQVPSDGFWRDFVPVYLLSPNMDSKRGQGFFRDAGSSCWRYDIQVQIGHPTPQQEAWLCGPEVKTAPRRHNQRVPGR